MPETGLSYGLQNDVQACNYAKVLRPTERCESGRIGQSRKLLSWQRDRGFDPHPLRQTKLARADSLPGASILFIWFVWSVWFFG